MSKKQINDLDGINALESYLKGQTTKEMLNLAVRYSLQEISKLYPGKSVEIRVPPAGATQILQGNTHRRGKPPAVVECSPETWIELCLGILNWDSAINEYKVEANGQRSDLSNILPIFKISNSENSN